MPQEGIKVINIKAKSNSQCLHLQSYKYRDAST